MGDHLGSIHFVSFLVWLGLAEILGKLGKFANFTNQLEFRQKTQIPNLTGTCQHQFCQILFFEIQDMPPLFKYYVFFHRKISDLQHICI